MPARLASASRTRSGSAMSVSSQVRVGMRPRPGDRHSAGADRAVPGAGARRLQARISQSAPTASCKIPAEPGVDFLEQDQIGAKRAQQFSLSPSRDSPRKLTFQETTRTVALSCGQAWPYPR